MTYQELVSAIRRAILQADLSPGQRLVEPDLSIRLGVSRADLRRAFVDLSYEGLIERIHNRGARVRMLRHDEILDLIEVRQVVEELCIRCVVDRMDDHGIVVLLRIRTQMTHLMSTRNVSLLRPLIIEVSNAYVGLSHNPVVGDTLRKLLIRETAYRLQESQAMKVASHWVVLIDAICDRNIDSAIRILYERPAVQLS